MSRFFATGTDSESESSSEDEPVVRAPAPVYTVSCSYEYKFTNAEQYDYHSKCPTSNNVYVVMMLIIEATPAASLFVL